MTNPTKSGTRSATTYTNRSTRIPGCDTSVPLRCRYESGISKFTAEVSDKAHSMWDELRSITGRGDSEDEAVKDFLSKAVKHLMRT